MLQTEAVNAVLAATAVEEITSTATALTVDSRCRQPVYMRPICLRRGATFKMPSLALLNC